MKKLFIALIFLLSPVFAFAEMPVVTRGYVENIRSYSVDAELKDDATINIEETITYDFGDNEKHGIFRYIPTVYEGRYGNPRQSLNIKSITDSSGHGWAYEKSEENGSQVLKIGDPDKLVTGVQTYIIKYSLTHMVSGNSDGDRFRWDAIGTGWNVHINNVFISLSNTSGQLQNRQTLHCYTGGQGSGDTCDYIESAEKVIVAAESLYPHAGITLDSLYKSGTFPSPSKLEIFIWETTWYYWLAPLAFLVFFAIWFEKGRDPKGRGTIVPMYDPPRGVTPYESSIILEEMISKRALPAAIISLAIKGYIKIHKKEVKVLFTSRPEYELELLKPLPEDASIVEKKINNLFFFGRTKVNLNDLGTSFPELNASLHRTAYKEVTEKGYFVVSPTISRIIFFAVSLALVVFGLMVAIFMLLEPLGYISLILPGVIAFLFALIMPVRTKSGAIIKEELLGLKMYIQAAEIDRIKFHNAPEKNPAKFEELLPYAILFGLEKKWAEEFGDIYKTPPSWYDGNLATFSVLSLSHDLGGFSNAAISAAISSSSGGGAGGFSGGGGGGGGGGSW